MWKEPSAVLACASKRRKKEDVQMESQAATKEGADAIRTSFAAATPLNRIESPEALTAAVLFLASDESSYVAGADLVIDGGLSAVWG